MKRRRSPDAIDQLEADHLQLHALFERYRELVGKQAPAHERRALAEEICTELTIHAKVEEELFYPAVRVLLDDESLADEADGQRGSVREIMGQILTGSPDDALYDAKVAVLAEYAGRHVRHEREQVFNRLLACAAELESLGTSIALRKQELRTVAEALREDTVSSALA